MKNWIALFEEASVDDVYELLYAFEAEHESVADAIYNELYVEDSGEFPQLFMAGYPEDGFSKEAALKIVEPLVTKMKSIGWFLAKAFETRYDDGDEDEFAGEPQILIYFGFFPQKGQAEIVPQQVYHISPRSNREMILRDGIKASSGGSDFIHTETGRVYVILDDIQIEAIKKDIKKHRGHDPKWTDLDVWVVDAWAVPDEWYEDVELAGAAAWTPHDIPASATYLMSPKV